MYECKAKGVFRKDNQKPLVGDRVEMDLLDEVRGLGNISRLLPRESELIRPAVANVDQALVIFAIVKPEPNFNLLDRFLIMMGRQEIDCIICFNKADMDAEGIGREFREIYAGCGYRTLTVSAKERTGIAELKDLLMGHTTAGEILRHQLPAVRCDYGDRGDQRKDSAGKAYHQAFGADSHR